MRRSAFAVLIALALPFGAFAGNSPEPAPSKTAAAQTKKVRQVVAKQVKPKVQKAVPKKVVKDAEKLLRQKQKKVRAKAR